MPPKCSIPSCEKTREKDTNFCTTHAYPTKPAQSDAPSAERFWKTWWPEQITKRVNYNRESDVSMAFAEAYAALRTEKFERELGDAKFVEKEITAAYEAKVAQLERERESLRFRLFYYNPESNKGGSSHTTACSIWREDGQGNAEGFEGSRGPCNCGALENYERKRATAAESALSEARERAIQECMMIADEEEVEAVELQNRAGAAMAGQIYERLKLLAGASGAAEALRVTQQLKETPGNFTSGRAGKGEDNG